MHTQTHTEFLFSCTLCNNLTKDKHTSKWSYPLMMEQQSQQKYFPHLRHVILLQPCHQPETSMSQVAFEHHTVVLRAPVRELVSLRTRTRPQNPGTRQEVTELVRPGNPARGHGTC